MVRVDFLQQGPGAAGELSVLGLSQGMHTGFGDHRLRIGPAKMFADGSLIGRTSYMFEPFATDPGNTGFLVVPEDVLKDRILRLHQSGLAVGRSTPSATRPSRWCWMAMRLPSVLARGPTTATG